MPRLHFLFLFTRFTFAAYKIQIRNDHNDAQTLWITSDFETNQIHLSFLRQFDLAAPVVAARATICGLDLYHFEVNGQKAGDEYFKPYCNTLISGFSIKCLTSPITLSLAQIWCQSCWGTARISDVIAPMGVECCSSPIHRGRRSLHQSSRAIYSTGKHTTPALIGIDAVVEPYFTFFGFRYVKVTGLVGDFSVDDFTGCVVYSRIDTIGDVETSNAKVNQLFKNAIWGQKGNFLAIPTDYPQRGEWL